MSEWLAMLGPIPLMVLSAVFSLAIFAVIFSPLERLVPIVQRGWWRRHLATDLAFLFGNFLVWTPLVNLALIAMLSWLLATLPLATMQAHFATLPIWGQCVLALLLSDCSVYWFHRLSHALPCLWRWHRTHHSAAELDWVAAYREHPVDNLLTRLVENLPLVLLGLPLPAIAGLVIWRGLVGLYIHSNIQFDPGPLRFLIGSPRLHHWHHERERGGATNFANLNPLMDLLFGTYHDPRRYPEQTATADEADPGYLAQLLRPFRRSARN